MKWIFIVLVGEDLIDIKLNGIHCWAIVVSRRTTGFHRSGRAVVGLKFL